tara:strand:+ start:927 stop:1604 length:678 start_codon:yes stop_codon:yes gene_type:complete
MSERDIRRINNTKQSSIEFNGKPSVNGMLDGQIAIEKKSNSQLALYRKKFGKLFKVYMTSDGNQVVDKTLTTSSLKYTNKFTDYRAFSHNFTADVDASKLYLPWFNDTELATFRTAQGYLAPYKMTCHKLIFKPPNLDDNADNITFAIEKKDDGDDTTDALCNYTYSTTFVDHTSVTINKSDWSADPVIDAGDVVALTITASDAGIVTSSKSFWITSVWKTEVVI